MSHTLVIATVKTHEFQLVDHLPYLHNLALNEFIYFEEKN